jgi:glucosamine-6-phosphate deaminase
MQIELAPSADGLARRAADIVCAAVREKPEAVVGLASGKTPLGLYAELARRLAAGEVDLRSATAFAIDELYGVPRNHPATNASYFARQVTFPLRELHVMDSEARDAGVECARFRHVLETAGGFDLLLLGIGRNGHLAFNEPGSPFDSHARKVALERTTREQYVDFLGSLDATPAYGLTLGIADLVAARSVLLLASGAEKADIVARALEGPIDQQAPASALQGHPNVTALLDWPAAVRLHHPTS